MVGTWCGVTTVTSTILPVCWTWESSTVFCTAESQALNVYRNVMKCACGVSTVFGILCMVGTCLCDTKRSSQLCQCSGFLGLPRSAARPALVRPARSCSARTSDLLLGVLQLWIPHGLPHPLCHWDLVLRRDKNLDDLNDEPQLLRLQALSGPSAPVVAQTGMSKSQPCSRAAPATWSRLPNALASLLATCVEAGTVDSTGRFYPEELGRVLNPDWHLLHLHHELVLRLVSSRLNARTWPAVGFALSPAVRSLQQV